jgi:hypothetical protein
MFGSGFIIIPGFVLFKIRRKIGKLTVKTVNFTVITMLEMESKCSLFFMSVSLDFVCSCFKNVI